MAPILPSSRPMIWELIVKMRVLASVRPEDLAVDDLAEVLQPDKR